MMGGSFFSNKSHTSHTNPAQLAQLAQPFHPLRNAARHSGFLSGTGSKTDRSTLQIR